MPRIADPAILAIAILVLCAPLVGCGDGFCCPLGTEEVYEGFVDIPEVPNPNPDRKHTCRIPFKQLHGPYEVLRHDGSLKVQGTHYFGEQCGTWRTYDLEGGLISREEYDRCGLFAYPGHL